MFPLIAIKGRWEDGATGNAKRAIAIESNSMMLPVETLSPIALYFVMKGEVEGFKPSQQHKVAAAQRFLAHYPEPIHLGNALWEAEARSLAQGILENTLSDT
ncbi:hypothetical protein DOJK_01367 [Patescibacteria group bacterium]|nr:hypothetical protein [Candidatus Dojkabacteria bacterium]CAG1021983.1 hypothetical protein DOJK_01367 [Patescibacteria group bacterium]